MGLNLGAKGIGIEIVLGLGLQRVKIEWHGNTHNDDNNDDSIILWCEWLQRPAAWLPLLDSIIDDIFDSIT
jgi:hypothetical protein